MPEFLQQFGAEAQCEAVLEAARWPNRFVCSRCGGSARTSFMRAGLRYRQCGGCTHQRSPVRNMTFGSTKLALTRWFLAMQPLTPAKNKVAALELMRQIEVSYRTVWQMKHKINERMRLREQPRELDGRVEMDDTYLGGDRSGGARGCSSENKVPIVTSVQTMPEGRPVMVCLGPQPRTEPEVSLSAAWDLAISTTVTTKALWCFQYAAMVGTTHQRVVTAVGRARVELPQFKAINKWLGNLKTAASGTYHAFGFAKFAQRHLAEF